jgi:hypothetical protein
VIFDATKYKAKKGHFFTVGYLPIKDKSKSNIFFKDYVFSDVKSAGETSWVKERLIKFQLRKVIEESSIQSISLKWHLAKGEVMTQMKKGWKLRPILRHVLRDPLTDPYLYTLDRFIILNQRPDSFKSNWCKNLFKDYYETARVRVPRHSGYFEFNNKDWIIYQRPCSLKQAIETYLEALNDYGDISIPYFDHLR